MQAERWVGPREIVTIGIRRTRGIVAGHYPAIQVDGIDVRRRGLLSHELSIPGTDGTVFGFDPASNVSMMIMRPPQQGQGERRAFGSSDG